MKITLDYTKPMLDTIKQIRDRVPQADKARARFSNPNLFADLADYLSMTNDEGTKVLINNLFEQAKSKSARA